MNDLSTDGRKVQLGCGTLILIALIVIVFGSGAVSDDVEDLEREVRALREEIVLLREEVGDHEECHAEEREADQKEEGEEELPLEATD